MPIKNYSTTVPAWRSVAEIRGLLARAGATMVTDYLDRGHVTGIEFGLATALGEQVFRLPARTDKTWALLKLQVSQNVGRDRAEAVAWRTLKDWVAAQLALIETAQTTLPEIMFPYLLGPGGQSVYQLWQSRQLALPAAGETARG